MQITFLGTSCMVPTKERNHTSIFLSYKSEGILIDCGEGTQRQMKIAGIKPSKITTILITHWHGDHVLGLPGLIQTLGASEYTQTLHIYGPKGTKEHIKAISKAFIFDRPFEMKVHDIEKGKVVDKKDFKISCLPLKHGIAALGYTFEEKDKRKVNMKAAKKLGLKEGPTLGKLQDGESVKFNGNKINPDDVTSIIPGKKITVILDTKLCKNCYELAENADLLICEATYSSKYKDKAEMFNHITAKDAALIASQSNVKELVLTHFSTRYKNTLEVQEDAQNVFQNVTCAEDFMKIKL